MPSGFESRSRDLRKEFGLLICQARQARSLTQRGLAAKMNFLGADIDERRISLLEHGDGRITMLELLKISYILDIDLNAFASDYVRKLQLTSQEVLPDEYTGISFRS